MTYNHHIVGPHARMEPNYFGSGTQAELNSGNTFTVGDWIRWITDQHVKEGQVIRAVGPSMVVRWLSGEEQVFPVVEGYLPPYSGRDARMVVIPRPPKASQIERDIKRGRMSVSRAAATLGVTPKRVRAMLRGGQLVGTQKEGKWTHVEL